MNDPHTLVGRNYHHPYAPGVTVRVYDVIDSHIVSRGWLVRFGWLEEAGYQFSSCTVKEFLQNFKEVKNA